LNPHWNFFRAALLSTPDLRSDFMPLGFTIASFDDLSAAFSLGSNNGFN